jgi:hypothetical protein
VEQEKKKAESAKPKVKEEKESKPSAKLTSGTLLSLSLLSVACVCVSYVPLDRSLTFLRREETHESEAGG